MRDQNEPRIPLPKGWKRHVRLAVVHVISLAHFCMIRVRGKAAQSASIRVRHTAEIDQLKQELVLINEQMRIKDARMARIDPLRRPEWLKNSAQPKLLD